MNSENKPELDQTDTMLNTEKNSVKNACCGIYGLKNKTNGKWYVGQSMNSIKSRWNEYKRFHCKGQVKLFRALKKYGYEAFDKILLEEISNPSKEVIDFKEDYWIKFYDSVETGYNCRYGGSNGAMSTEAKKKIKEWSINPVNRKAASNRTKKYINGFGHPWTGKTHTDESKVKMASHNRSGFFSPSYGRMWINDGKESKKILKTESIPDGFKLGRLFGTVRINNGIDQKFYNKNLPIPTGYIVGMFCRRKHRLCD